MRRSTAITLLVLGTGTVVTAVALTDRCQPGQTGACSSAYGGSHYVGFVSGGTSSPGTARAEDGDGGKKSISTNKSGAGTSVSSSATAHGGFGASGAHASSSGS